MSEPAPPWEQSPQAASEPLGASLLLPGAVPQPPRYGPGYSQPSAPSIGMELAVDDYLHDPSLAPDTKYRPAFAKIAEVLCTQLAATDFHLCEIFGISNRTLIVWRTRHPEFRAACLLGLEACSDNVERALYHRAVGYTHEEQKVHFDKHGDVHTYDTTKHYPPDTQAIALWLTNKRKKVWANRMTATIDAPELVSVDDIMNKLFQGVPQ